jgi:hypothetical protein
LSVTSQLDMREKTHSRNTTHQSECLRCKLGLLEERNSNLAGDDAEVGGISGLEELVKHPFLLGRQIEIGMALWLC